MEFNRTYMGIHDMWKDLGWRIEMEFEPDSNNPNVLIWYAWRVFGGRPAYNAYRNLGGGC